MKFISILFVIGAMASVHADVNYSKIKNALKNPSSQVQYDYFVEDATNQIMKDYLKNKNSLDAFTKISDEDLIVFDGVVENLAEHLKDTRVDALFTRLEQVRNLQKEDAQRSFATRGVPMSREAKVVDLKYDEIVGLELNGLKFPEKTILLTFDDGPHGYRTDIIMDALEKYNIPGTFFFVGRSMNTTFKDAAGNNVDGASVAEDIIKRGHTLGTHSWSHPMLAKIDAGSAQRDIDKAVKLVIQKFDYFPHFFRFPYGSKSEALRQYMSKRDYSKDVENGAEGMKGIKSIFWSMDSNDWKTKNPTALVQQSIRTFQSTKRGVFLMHDVHHQTEVAFPILLDWLVANGWTFVRLVN